jgi:hypothetical protein
MANWDCCRTDFNSLLSYRAHLKHHENVQSLIVCNICGHHNTNYNQFKTHYNSKHKDHDLNILVQTQEDELMAMSRHTC